MKKSILLVFTVIAVMLTSNGCKKGDTGPQGPAGTNGTNGTNGNANVSGQPPITLSNWTYNASSNSYSAGATNPAITQEIVDKGIVMIYEQWGSSWLALPITNYNVSRYFSFTVGSWTVYYRNIDGTTTANPGSKTYRSVYITPSNRMAYPNLNYYDYEEVKRTFNLKD